MKNTFNKLAILCVLLVSISLLGCESKKADSGSKGEESAKKSDSNSTKITMTVGDAMKFDKTEIKVKAGSTVTLTITHTGKMKKEVMGHNFVLLKKGTDIAEFGKNAMAAKATDYVPAGSALANTKVVGGGESDTITFKVPEKGTYDFICSFPGHFSMMKGKFIVE